MRQVDAEPSRQSALVARNYMATMNPKGFLEVVEERPRYPRPPGIHRPMMLPPRATYGGWLGAIIQSPMVLGSRYLLLSSSLPKVVSYG
jgi:hypothetical protein